MIVPQPAIRFALAATLGLLLLAGAAPRAAAQEDESLEWNMNGSLRVRGFGLSSGTNLDPTPLNTGVATGDDATFSYLDTRLRLAIRVTAYQEVSAVIGIEVGDFRFGDEGGGTPGRLGTDRVIFENKNLYLEWHPTRFSFKLRAGLYPRESDPYGIVLSNDVAGIHGEWELLGTSTALYADVIKAVENSRNDLDGDGQLDNDYNDRTIFIVGATTTAIPRVSLEYFLMADENDTDTTVSNKGTKAFWNGLTLRTRIGPVQVASTWIHAYGKRVRDNAVNQTIKGFATDTRIKFDIPFVTVEGIFAWASGNNPNDVTTDTAFPVITPFYGVSSIVYQSMSGFSVTGSNLSGTGHATLKLSASPLDGMDVTLFGLWAWYTSDRNISTNTVKFNKDARDLGFETGLYVNYQIVEGFKVFARQAIFFPSKGYLVQEDTNHRGALAQVIVGAQLSF